MNVLSAASANNFINTVLNNRKLASVKHHTNVGVAEVEFLISRAAPGELAHFAGLHITQKQSAVGGGDEETILVNVNLTDFIAILRFKHDALSVLDATDKHLGE